MSERAAVSERADGILPLELVGLGFEVAGQPLLAGVTAHLAAGPRSVVLGPNGAGKSLLLRLCHGLLRPSRGTVRWAGGNGTRRRQAMVFQRPVLLRRSALANVAYPLKLRGVLPAARRRRAEEALSRAGLAALAGRPARVLSGGEQQRLAIARAWVTDPEVLFLDEPTASLDPRATREVEDLIRAIQASGSKIVMTTHDLGQAQRLADEVLFLHGGRLLERAEAEAFFAGPRTPEARAFIKGELLP